jgi:hypothetical protein
MLHILSTRGDHKIAEPGLVMTEALWIDLLDPTSGTSILYASLGRATRAYRAEDVR